MARLNSFSKALAIGDLGVKIFEKRVEFCLKLKKDRIVVLGNEEKRFPRLSCMTNFRKIGASEFCARSFLDFGI
jgi:hypothetical protein